MGESINEQKAKKYYETLQNSYNTIWMNKKNLAMHYGFWNKDTKNLHEALINENKYISNALGIKKSDMVLDAGCGIGGTSIWIAEEYGAYVTGISIVGKQIKLAENMQRKGKWTI